jgi:hypothetical protein
MASLDAPTRTDLLKKRKRPSYFINTLSLRRQSTPLSSPLSPATPTEIIKLSTVNKSGIYLPPSPTDEGNQNEDYFVESPLKENFYIPYSKERAFMCTEPKSLFTPSNHV